MLCTIRWCVFSVLAAVVVAACSRPLVFHSIGMWTHLASKGRKVQHGQETRFCMQ